MLDDDQLFTKCFEQGRRAARVGRPLNSNPYLDVTSEELAAWVEGFASVDTSVLIPSKRARIFNAGEDAALAGETASLCPHLNDDDPERLEIWLMGYAPDVELDNPLTVRRT